MCLTNRPSTEPSPDASRSRPPRTCARRLGRRRRLAWCALGVVLGLIVVALAVLAAIPATGAPPTQPVAEQPTPRGGYRWPLDGTPRITRPFEPPPEPWAAGHRGVDLAGTPGMPVRAAANGVVHFAGTVVDRGVVGIRHTAGLRTTYEPVTPLVRSGQPVRAGDVIGTLASGHTGCPVAACLHWGLRRGDQYLDPLTLLGAGRVRLLPVSHATSTHLQALPGAAGSGRFDRVDVTPSDVPAGTPAATARPRHGCRSELSQATRGRASPAPPAGRRRPPGDA